MAYTSAMAKAPQRTAAELIPPHPTLRQLETIARKCTACHLYEKATQTVFGEGAEHAKTIFVGEQPGDQEDKQGHPFVGPAGRLLDKALEGAGIDRAVVYVTNVVKHFKWEPRGKRRIHEKPNAMEIRACKPWLDSEIQLIQPKVVVCLGATAAQALMGKEFKVTQERGKIMKAPFADNFMATMHPSSIVRAPDKESYELMLGRFIDDLKGVAHLIAG